MDKLIEQCTTIVTGKVDLLYTIILILAIALVCVLILFRMYMKAGSNQEGFSIKLEGDEAFKNPDVSKIISEALSKIQYPDLGGSHMYKSTTTTYEPVKKARKKNRLKRSVSVKIDTTNI